MIPRIAYFFSTFHVLIGSLSECTIFHETSDTVGTASSNSPPLLALD